jgi:diketogulonate reductase-like aldo/keto reductase
VDAGVRSIDCAAIYKVRNMLMRNELNYTARVRKFLVLDF